MNYILTNRIVSQDSEYREVQSICNTYSSCSKETTECIIINSTYYWEEFLERIK